MLLFSRALCLIACSFPFILSAKDIDDITPDLQTPPVENGKPAPGKRVRQFINEYKNGEVHHLLYLPEDWEPGKKFPVIVEYAGNRWKSQFGTVDNSNLGYGLSGGKGVIWVCMPFVDKKNGRNAITWWGDAEATVDYCKRVVQQICDDFGGDRSALFLAGFSRGAIACNYIGLRDDEIAALWCGFICHSHYDGVKKWPYSDSDSFSAKRRLLRLGKRPQLISHENSVEQTQSYLQKVYPQGNFQFLPLSFTNHTDTWVLRDIPERKILRTWFQKQLKQKSQSFRVCPN